MSGTKVRQEDLIEEALRIIRRVPLFGRMLHAYFTKAVSREMKS